MDNQIEPMPVVENKKPIDKKLVGILLIVVILTVSIILALIFFIRSAGNSSNKTPSPTISEPQTGTGLEEKAENPEIMLQNRGYKLSKLGAKLPYSGTNFSLSYDLNEDEFTLYINPSAQKEGNDELNNYLKENGIESLSWITNLKRTNQKF